MKAQASNSIRVTLRKNKLYYALILPGLLYFIIFHYVPLYGIIIAFKDVAPFDGLRGIFSSEWVGLKHFRTFMGSYYFWDILGNTIIISFYRLLFGFPAPIILALLMNEVRVAAFKKFVQTISYLPHFISMVVMAGLITTVFALDGGILNGLLQKLGVDPVYFLGDTNYFRSVLVTTGIWKEVGWGTIIYLAAITGIDPQQYEAAVIDGASKIKQIWHITLPGMMFVIVIMFIFAVGGLLNAGFEQIFLLYSPPVYKVADIIDTYVYRKGMVEMQYSFATAVAIFKSAIAMVLLLGTNYLAKKLNQEGIW
ncbi:ABC transporter permease [Paenibacillus nasutitermitis]|uniref:Protein LplB n=1 Tax=Paenibacillus nasutitermitis TaxID=1652958 RepID=A0A916YL37_9BACL|nr:ABC transporter permease subunit [Paenibacillus nasutitermitis]GGD50889.1 protein LplB [Paenibacillus nasutitermitis]